MSFGGLFDWVLIIAGVLVCVKCVVWLIGIRYISNNEVGIVTKWWSKKGSLKEQIIALHGESGYQPEILRGGLHWLSPVMYKVQRVPLVTIPQGQIGYVFARDGQPLEPTQTLGRVIPECNNFQDVRAFLENGGQKGPQRGIIREGTYAFNLAQFVIITAEKAYYLPMDSEDESSITQMINLIAERDGFRPVVISGQEDKIGIVTIHDGPSLSKEAGVIAPIVGDAPADSSTYHNNFQNPDKFLSAGGFRGRQYQVLTDGTYYLNQLFATVELVDKTIVDVGYVGVVVSYIGNVGSDSSGDLFKHGELVEKDCRGVWREPLMPGKYAFNTYAGKVIMVPTTNVILKWVGGITGSHKYDDNLKEVGLITKDAFEPSLPLSVVLHIDFKKAPMVIQRFGNIQALVEQTLDPMVSAYFKNIGQTKTLIELIQHRDEIQQRASSEMKDRFLHYDLELEEVLIGTPSASTNDHRIEDMLTQLRERQIAREQIETYNQQQQAATKEIELREAQARAEQQTVLTQSLIKIQIEENTGKADLQRALQEAAKTKALAEANAEQEARIGIGKAIAIRKQVQAYGGPEYQVVQEVMSRFTEAIREQGIPIVPNTVITSGDSKGSTGNAFEILLNLLLSEKLKNLSDDNKKLNEEEPEEIKNMENRLLKSISTSHSEVAPSSHEEK